VRLREAEIVSREDLGSHRLLRCRWRGEEPSPGQFLMVRPGGSTLSYDPFLSRPFFVHDFEGDVVSLLFEVRGRGTELLAREEGGLLLGGPLGRGYPLPEAGPVALVGGGVWVSPLGFLARRLEELGVEHEVFLEVPAGAPEAYVEGLRGLFPWAELVPTGPDGPPGALLGAIGDLSRYRALYASGPAATLRAVAGAGVPAYLAVRERMACGTGACRGCAVPVRRPGGLSYARACAEGPVFAAEEIAW